MFFESLLGAATRQCLRPATPLRNSGQTRCQQNGTRTAGTSTRSCDRHGNGCGLYDYRHFCTAIVSLLWEPLINQSDRATQSSVQYLLRTALKDRFRCTPQAGCREKQSRDFVTLCNDHRPMRMNEFTCKPQLLLHLPLRIRNNNRLFCILAPQLRANTAVRFP